MPRPQRIVPQGTHPSRPIRRPLGGHVRLGKVGTACPVCKHRLRPSDFSPRTTVAWDWQRIPWCPDRSNGGHTGCSPDLALSLVNMGLSESERSLIPQAVAFPRRSLTCGSIDAIETQSQSTIRIAGTSSESRVIELFFEGSRNQGPIGSGWVGLVHVGNLRSFGLSPGEQTPEVSRSPSIRLSGPESQTSGRCPPMKGGTTMLSSRAPRVAREVRMAQRFAFARQS